MATESNININELKGQEKWSTLKRRYYEFDGTKLYLQRDNKIWSRRKSPDD